MVQAIPPVREDSESALIARAQTALSRCNWEVGECAALWTKRFARGRTDADFGMLVGLSADQVYQRRRVWETFSDVYQNYSSLKWSHFYSALNWDDAAECLQWAADVQAGVAEMKAWRRAQRGEDLNELSVEDGVSFGGAELTFVGEAAPFESDSPKASSATETRQLATLAAGEADGGATRFAGADDASVSSYAPFRSDAASIPPREDVPRPEPTTEQLVKRMTTAIERCHAAINDQFCLHFAKLPEKVRLRFLKAIEQLNDKTSELSE